MPLPGLGAHALLAAGSPVLTVAARQLADGASYASFLCPCAGREPEGRHVRVTVLACPAQAPYHLVAVVVLSAPGDIYGLTGRELEILGLLIEGWSNRRIAAVLDISEYATAAHLEYIGVKLDASTRVLAMLRAACRGLYVPRSLTTQQCSDQAITDHGALLPRALEQPLPVPRPTPVKRAVEAIEAHPEYPFTIRRLAQISNVSVRTLQEAFRQHMGISPMSYLRQIRLARVHDDLHRADAGHITVARTPTGGVSAISAGSPPPTGQDTAPTLRTPCISEHDRSPR